MRLTTFIRAHKLILFLSFFIFLIAFLTRISAYLDYSNLIYTDLHFFELFGSGADAEYQTKNAIYEILNTGYSETFTHLDYLFLIPYIALFLKFFGFLGGIQVLMLATIIAGSLVPVIIFILLSLRKKYSIAGFFAGLFLAINPLLTDVSAGRFVLDTGVMFTFSIFLFCYVFAIERKTIPWIVALGCITLIQGLNKPFLFVNDIPLMIMFSILFLLEDFTLHKRFPFISLSFRITPKKILTSLVPLIILILGNVILEIFELSKYNHYYFLGEILFSKHKDSTSNFILRDSLLASVPLLEKIKNVITFSLIAIQWLLSYVPFASALMATAIVSWVLHKKNPIKKLVIVFSFVVIIALVFSTVTKTFLLPFQYLTQPSGWKAENFLAFSLFFVFLLLFLSQSKKYFSFGIMQLVYLWAVGMSISTAIAPRHFVTIVIWFTFCLCVLLDQFATPFLSRVQKRVYYLCLFLIVLIFASPIHTMFRDLNLNTHYLRNNIAYYRWISSVVSPQDYIMGGTGDDMVLLSVITQRTILYNSLFTPFIIHQNASIYSLDYYGSTHNKRLGYKEFIENHTKTENKTGKLFVLDNNADKWKQILSADAKGEFPKDKYKLVEVQNNDLLGRKLFQMIEK